MYAHKARTWIKCNGIVYTDTILSGELSPDWALEESPRTHIENVAIDRL